MTPEERISNLESRLAMAEARIATLEQGMVARAASPLDFTYAKPYEVTCRSSSTEPDAPFCGAGD